MKKTLLTLMTLALAGSVCFAQDKAAEAKSAPKAAATRTAVKSEESKSFTGKVESVTIGNAAKKTRSEVTAVNEQGTKMTFLVKSSAAITKDGKKAALGDVKKDSGVKVKYTTGSTGKHRARSIEIE